VELRPRALIALAALAAAVLLLVLPAGARAAGLQFPSSQTQPPTGYRLNARQAIALAQTAVKVRDELRKHPGLRPYAYVERPRSWQVSWFDRKNHEKAQVLVDDPSGTVLEAWTGYQVAWRMARGYPGAFGRRFNAIYVWLPLGLLFLLPFVDPRRPFRLLHLDMLMLVGFAVSHFFFERGNIGVSVPLVYPVLGYLLVRMLVAGLRPRRRSGRLVPFAPVWALGLAVLFLTGFRIGLNLTDSNVIDVGYSGVIGADYITHGHGLYNGNFPADNAHGDTYGPVNYLAYVPFEQVFPWHGKWDSLPAAHAAAVAFDLLTLLGLFLLGRRLRAGPRGTALGVTLAFAWAAYPYSLFVLSTNANDSLIAALVVFALLALASPPGRGVLLALAAAAKFAPLALAPLFARGRGALRSRGTVIAALAMVAVLLAAFLPFVPHGGLHALWHRTLGSQVNRSSPFSVWGQTSLGRLHVLWEALSVALALAVALVPRRRSAIQVAALAAAVLIAFQIGAQHWFYLYIVWFAPLVFVALFAQYEDVTATAEPARSSVPVRRPLPRSQRRSATDPLLRSRTSPASSS
jgi:Glycosyltransferase family 87